MQWFYHSWIIAIIVKEIKKRFNKLKINLHDMLTEIMSVIWMVIANYIEDCFHI